MINTKYLCQLRKSQDFGLRVRELRARAGITQEQLAARANLSRVYISNIERGKRNVTLQNIENIAAAFRVSMEYIFSGERFSTTPTFQKEEALPFTERFRWHLDPDRRLLSFTIEGLLSTKQEVKQVHTPDYWRLHSLSRRAGCTCRP